MCSPNLFCTVAPGYGLQLWDSGFISVPYNFKINELPSKIKLLQAGQRLTDQSSGSSANGQPSLVAHAAAAPVPHIAVAASSSCISSGCSSGVRQLRLASPMRHGQAVVPLRLGRLGAQAQVARTGNGALRRVL